MSANRCMEHQVYFVAWQNGESGRVVLIKRFKCSAKKTRDTDRRKHRYRQTQRMKEGKKGRLQMDWKRKYNRGCIRQVDESSKQMFVHRVETATHALCWSLFIHRRSFVIHTQGPRART